MMPTSLQTAVPTPANSARTSSNTPAQPDDQQANFAASLQAARSSARSEGGDSSPPEQSPAGQPAEQDTGAAPAKSAAGVPDVPAPRAKAQKQQEHSDGAQTLAALLTLSVRPQAPTGAPTTTASGLAALGGKAPAQGVGQSTPKGAAALPGSVLQGQGSVPFPKPALSFSPSGAADQATVMDGTSAGSRVPGQTNGAADPLAKHPAEAPAASSALLAQAADAKQTDPSTPRAPVAQSRSAADSSERTTTPAQVSAIAREGAAAERAAAGVQTQPSSSDAPPALAQANARQAHAASAPVAELVSGGAPSGATAPGATGVTVLAQNAGQGGDSSPDRGHGEGDHQGGPALDVAAAMQSTSSAHGAAAPEIAGAAATGPTGPQVAPAVGSPEWMPAVAHSILRAGGSGQIELNLNPTELGPLQVKLSLADGHAQIVFVSEHLAVRQALESALPQLRASFADSGINLGQTSVGSGSGDARAQYQQSQASATPHPGAASQAGAAPSVMPVRAARDTGVAAGVDIFA